MINAKIKNISCVGKHKIKVECVDTVSANVLQNFTHLKEKNEGYIPQIFLGILQTNI